MLMLKNDKSCDFVDWMRIMKRIRAKENLREQGQSLGLTTPDAAAITRNKIVLYNKGNCICFECLQSITSVTVSYPFDHGEFGYLTVQQDLPLAMICSQREWL